MVDTMEFMKDKVEAYQKLLMQKEEIEKQYIEWNSCYEEAIRISEEVREAYEKDKTPEKEREYLSWVQETQDYFAIVCEYTKKFVEINKEIEVQDQKMREAEIGYITTITKYHKVCSKMNELKRTWDVYKKSGVTGDKVKILVEEYHKLVEVKKVLEAELRDNFNLAINGISTEEIEDFNEKIPKINDSMTLDEKIAKKKEEMECYLSASGKKTRMPYKKKPLVIAAHCRDKYIKADRELTKLLQEKEKLENNIPVTTPVTNSEGLEKLFNFEDSEDKFEIPKQKQYQLPDEEKKHTENLQGALFSAYHVPEEDLTKDEKLMSGFSGVENYQSLMQQKQAIIDEEENAKLDEELINMVNKHSEELNKKEEKPTCFMKILNMRKPKNKIKLKDAITKKVLVIAAAAVIAATSIYAVKNTLINNITTSKKDNLPVDDEIVYELTEEDVKDIVDSSNIVEDSATKQENAAVQEESDVQIKFGDKFNVTTDAGLYDDMYDAQLNRNSVQKYFSPEYERTVGGIIVKYDGGLFCIYANDPEAKEKLDMYLVNGGKITGVLSELSSGYEGFYKIDDVKSLEKSLGGINR